jgi:hypothetical protein
MWKDNIEMDLAETGCAMYFTSTTHYYLSINYFVTVLIHHLVKSALVYPGADYNSTNYTTRCVSSFHCSLAL